MSVTTEEKSALKQVAEIIARELKGHGTFTVRSLGRFTTSRHDFYNPDTGEVQPGTRVNFKPCRSLKAQTRAALLD